MNPKLTGNAFNTSATRCENNAERVSVLRDDTGFGGRHPFTSFTFTFTIMAPTFAKASDAAALALQYDKYSCQLNVSAFHPVSIDQAKLIDKSIKYR